MKVKDIREMSDEQLELTAKEASETLFRLRIQPASGASERTEPNSEESSFDRSRSNNSERAASSQVVRLGTLVSW